MKQALLFGCGSKNGIPIIDSCLDTNYHVTNIGSSPDSYTQNPL